MVRSVRWLGAFIASLLTSALGASTAVAWQPQPPSYGVGSQTNLAVRASDGVLLRANVYFPTDQRGKAAPGPFPVILTQTPYGKDNGAFSGALGAGENDYLVQRGYINVVADVRGTGGSQGQWGLFDPIQGHDGATLVGWAAKLPHSDGKVGLFGPSYLGIDQFATAVDAGPAHVKAMFPIISGNDLYRDTAFAGGFPDIEFDGIYLGLTAGLNLLLPAQEQNPDLVKALIDHVQDLSSFDASLVAGVETGGDQAYDQAYWGARNPVNQIEAIVRDRIPAFLVGGWYDLFQRGELLNYSGFQNAYEHRPVLAPMSRHQPVTPRYQLIQGPWYHVTAGMGLNYHGLGMPGVELAWFDHWLKGVDTGITDTSTPLHVEDLATGNYEEASRYPLDQATPRTLYLHPGGALTPSPPLGASAPDTLVFTGSQIPCTSATEQWAAGVGALALSLFKLGDPCTQTVNLSQLGPGTQSYTTAPFTSTLTLAGPIGATLYAATTTKDSEWVVQLSDVAPSGNATALSSGLLEGDQRALDGTRSWSAPDGKPLLPYHPYTKAAQASVTPGQVNRYEVEIFPTVDTLAPGHRLRVTVATADFPHALPSVTQLPGLLGGVYSLQHSSSYPSSVELPLVPAAPGSPGGLPLMRSTPLGCPAAQGSLSGAHLGPVRLGMSRAQARAAFVQSSTRGRRTMDFFCLFGSGIRAEYARGRVVLALSANRHYALGGIRPGARLRSARRLGLSAPFQIGRNAWYLTAGRSVRGVLKVRHGIIEEVGIADGRLLGNRRRARRFFMSFR